MDRADYETLTERPEEAKGADYETLTERTTDVEGGEDGALTEAYQRKKSPGKPHISLNFQSRFPLRPSVTQCVALPGNAVQEALPQTVMFHPALTPNSGSR